MEICKDKIIDFFNSQANDWDKYRDNDEKRLCEIASLCSIKEGDKVLDVACGTGIMTPYLLHTPAGNITGIDIAENMIKRAQKKHSDLRAKFIFGDIYEFDKTGWDVILIFNAYPHLAERTRLVKSIKRLLAPGGRFVIAHNPGLEKINEIHDGKPKDISLKLKPAQVEVENFAEEFNIDTLIDEKDLYIISGTAS